MIPAVILLKENFDIFHNTRSKQNSQTLLMIGSVGHKDPMN